MGIKKNKLKILNHQLALPLTFKTLKNRENFLVSECNQSAVQLIDNINFWQKNEKINSIPAIIIYGPIGCGKTHISSIFEQQNNCITLSSITSKDIRLAEKGHNFIVDNFSPGMGFSPEIVMHFINEVTYNFGSILFLSRFSAFDMQWDLDDLNSRLRSLMSCEIKLPDDILLYSFLVKYADDKKLFLTDKQCIYIIERVERNFESVIKIIDNLDRISFEIKRKLTFYIIQDVIDIINKN